MKSIFQLLVLFSLMSLFACKTAKPIRPVETYEERFETPVSVINIPIDIEMRELEGALNEQLKGVLYEDNNLNDGDKMMVRAEKVRPIRLALDSQAVKYQLPLKLWIKYDIGISTVEAEGEISIDFRTALDINREWDVNTTTDILTYEWIRKPRIKMGVVSLPVGFIADIILKRSKDLLTSSVDDMVKENFDLRGQITEAWQQMFKPVQVSEEYNTWLTIKPESIGMTPLFMGNDRISSTLFIEGKPDVSVGVEPEGIFPKPLPQLRIEEKADEVFALHIKTKITYDEAERIAKQEVVGQTFSQGKRSVTIQDLEFYGRGNKIIVNTMLTGSYNGSIYLEGIPVYNDRKNTIDIEDLQYTLDTKNVLFKSAGWLLKSAIKPKIEENLNFLMDYNLKSMQAEFQEQLKQYSVSEGVTIFGDLKELNIRNAYLTYDGMIVDLALEGQVRVKVTGLN
jgi:hypothetical protein